jgi:hydroxymethylbilane synthase
LENVSEDIVDCLRIATRRSPLALAQSTWVADRLAETHPGLIPELVPIVTAGDRNMGDLTEIGGKGLFTAELEDALRAGEVDLAVHSAKDMPTPLPEGLPIIATPIRADARDAFVSREGLTLEGIPKGGRVGTSSLRRRAQLLQLRPDINIVPIRGNVGTRMARALEGEERLDGVILAMAGLQRSGLLASHGQHIVPISPEWIIPAAGQGVLGLQGRADDGVVRRLAEGISDPSAAEALVAERGVTQAMEASCRSALAAYVWREGSARWRGMAMAARPDGTGLVRVSATGTSADQCSHELIDELNRNDAKRLLTMS